MHEKKRIKMTKQMRCVRREDFQNISFHSFSLDYNSFEEKKSNFTTIICSYSVEFEIDVPNFCACYHHSRFNKIRFCVRFFYMTHKIVFFLKKIVTLSNELVF